MLGLRQFGRWPIGIESIFALSTALRLRVYACQNECLVSGKRWRRTNGRNGGAIPTSIGLTTQPEHCCSGERGRV